MDMRTFFFSEAWSKACHEKSADAIVGETKKKKNRHLAEGLNFR